MAPVYSKAKKAGLGSWTRSELGVFGSFKAIKEGKSGEKRERKRERKKEKEKEDSEKRGKGRKKEY